MFGLHQSHRRAALTLGCCAAVLAVASAPAGAHTLSVEAVEVAVDSHTAGGAAECHAVRRHRVDCWLDWIGAGEEGADRHRYELHGGRILTDEETGGALAEFWTRRTVFVVGDADLRRRPFFELVVDYRTRNGHFYGSRIHGAEGNLRLTCPDGSRRMSRRTVWSAVPTAPDGRFERSSSDGRNVRGRLVGRSVKGWVSVDEDGCKSGRVPLSGAGNGLLPFIR